MSAEYLKGFFLLVRKGRLEAARELINELVIDLPDSQDIKLAKLSLDREIQHLETFKYLVKSRDWDAAQEHINAGALEFPESFAIKAARADFALQRGAYDSELLGAYAS